MSDAECHSKARIHSHSSEGETGLNWSRYSARISEGHFVLGDGTCLTVRSGKAVSLHTDLLYTYITFCFWFWTPPTATRL